MKFGVDFVLTHGVAERFWKTLETRETTAENNAKAYRSHDTITRKLTWPKYMAIGQGASQLGLDVRDCPSPKRAKIRHQSGECSYFRGYFRHLREVSSFRTP